MASILLSTYTRCNGYCCCSLLHASTRPLSIPPREWLHRLPRTASSRAISEKHVSFPFYSRHAFLCSLHILPITRAKVHLKLTSIFNHLSVTLSTCWFLFLTLGDLILATMRSCWTCSSYLICKMSTGFSCIPRVSTACVLWRYPALD